MEMSSLNNKRPVSRLLSRHGKAEKSTASASWSRLLEKKKSLHVGITGGVQFQRRLAIYRIVRTPCVLFAPYNSNLREVYRGQWKEYDFRTWRLPYNVWRWISRFSPHTAICDNDGDKGTLRRPTTISGHQGRQRSKTERTIVVGLATVLLACGMSYCVSPLSLSNDGYNSNWMSKYNNKNNPNNSRDQPECVCSSDVNRIGRQMTARLLVHRSCRRWSSLLLFFTPVSRPSSASTKWTSLNAFYALWPSSFCQRRQTDR